jgi:acetyl esterase
MVLNYGAFAPEHTPSWRVSATAAIRWTAPRWTVLADYVDSADQFGDPLVVPLRELWACRRHSSRSPNATYWLIAIWLSRIGYEAPMCRVHAVLYRGATHSFLEAVSIAPLAARLRRTGGLDPGIIYHDDVV